MYLRFADGAVGMGRKLAAARAPLINISVSHGLQLQPPAENPYCRCKLTRWAAAAAGGRLQCRALLRRGRRPGVRLLQPPARVPPFSCTPLLPSAGVSTGMKRGCQQGDRTIPTMPTAIGYSAFMIQNHDAANFRFATVRRPPKIQISRRYHIHP